MVVCKDRLGTVVAENLILEHDATTLQDEHNQVQPPSDVDATAWERFVRRQISPYYIGQERREGLVGAKEQLVREPAEERTCEQKEKTKRLTSLYSYYFSVVARGIDTYYNSKQVLGFV